MSNPHQADRVIARRVVLAGVGILAAAPATAQGKRPLIGYIGSSERQQRYEQAFLAGLRDSGLLPGRDADVEFAWSAMTKPLIDVIVAGLVARHVAVIVGGSGGTANAVRQSTSNVPIVFVTDPDPVANNMVESLARPGGNLTGLTPQTIDLAGKWIQILRELQPRLARLAVFHFASAFRLLTGVRLEIGKTAREVGILVTNHFVNSLDDYDRQIAQAVADGAEAGIMLRDPLSDTNRERIVALAARHRLPMLYEQSEFARAGGLVSFGTDLADMHRRAAGVVARILRGAAPASIPVEQPVRFELVLNLRAARALGLVPSSTLLAYADEVIE